MFAVQIPIEFRPGPLDIHVQGRHEGDDEALNQALPHLIERLRQLARHYLARERSDHTLQPTALIHEVYLRLLSSRAGRIESRAEFFAFAARLMRQILIDHARCRAADKRGNSVEKADLLAALGMAEKTGLDIEQLTTLNEAIERLGRLDPRQRKITEFRYYVGLTVEEIADVLEISVATVHRDWSAARRWLALELGRAQRTV